MSDEKDELCMCGHAESKHIKATDEFDDVIYRCSAKGCVCEAFNPMDEEDVKFLNTLMTGHEHD